MHRTTQHRSALPGVEARTLVSDRSFPRHTHDQLGIGVMVSGAHRSWSGVGAVEARAGDTIMCNPGEMHDGMPVAGRPREWRMLYLEPAVVARVAEREEATQAEVVRPVAQDPWVTARFARLFTCITAQAPEGLALDERLLSLVVCVLRRHGARPPVLRKCSGSVAKALACIDSDPGSGVRLAQLADLAGMSPFTLVRAFSREVGTTPHAYLVQSRVRLARNLLRKGSSIAEAAAASGFADQSHLTHVFFRHFGVTPGRYVAAIA